MDNEDDVVDGNEDVEDGGTPRGCTYNGPVFDIEAFMDELRNNRVQSIAQAFGMPDFGDNDYNFASAAQAAQAQADEAEERYRRSWLNHNRRWIQVSEPPTSLREGLVASWSYGDDVPFDDLTELEDWSFSSFDDGSWTHGGYTTRNRFAPERYITHEGRERRADSLRVLEAVYKRTVEVESRARRDWRQNDRQGYEDGQAYAEGLTRCYNRGLKMANDCLGVLDIINELETRKAEYAAGLSDSLSMAGYEGGIGILRARIGE